MSENFGLKIGLEGEREFKKALSEINQSFKVLGSEMKAVTSQFDKNDNSIQALTARNQELNKEIEAQKQKIDTLRSALSNAAEYFGENDRRTQQWQIQLNNATATLNEMGRELDRNNQALEDAEKEMDDVADSADDMGEEIDDAADSADKSTGKFDKLGSVLKGIGAAMGAAATAAGAAAVSLGKEVVNAYADYEQLVGGVDTLFKDSSKELQDYAAEAYKTSGLSANEYMETVTSFSASLIQSLGGDTDAAVKYADMAITDMADNANKMGTDISTIQSAYQGFAKQNYTMLDNLKLGYGGTKTEMERLLADAQKLSGVEYDISSYADVVDAIHVIQESMGIAGATAAEAENTISGSISSMKSSFENLIVGFGRSDADMGKLSKNIVDAFKNVVKNITPIVKNITKTLPTVAKTLVSSFKELLPTLISTITDLFSEVLKTLLELLPEILPVVMEGIMMISQALVDNLPLLVEAGTSLLVALIEGMTNALPDLIPMAIEAVTTIVQGLVDSLPLILDAALQLITGLADGILAALPVLIEALPQIITSIVEFIIDSIPQIIDAGIELLTSLVSALPDIIKAIVKVIPEIIDGIVKAVLEGLPQIIQAGIDLLTSLVKELPAIILAIVEAIPDIISGIVTALIDNIPLIVEAGVKLLTSLVEDLPNIILEIVAAIPDIITGIINAFAEGIPKMVEVGGLLIQGLWDGMWSLADWIWDKVTGFFDWIWDGICDFFGIASPSKEMAWVGEMLVEGLAGSIDENGKEAVDSATRMANDINDVMHDLSADMTAAVPNRIDIDSNLRDVQYTVADSHKTTQPLNVTIPLTVDGSTLARVMAEIQWSQSTAYLRNLGTV